MVWNNDYDIILIDALGNGNVAARYQDAYQSENYDVVFAFVDTDRKPYEQYADIKRKINDIYGLEVANEFVIFGNPCTLQIIILHFDFVLLPSHNKNKNAPIVEKYTGINCYNAKAEKRKQLFDMITVDNYNHMRERIIQLFDKDTEKK